MAMLQERLQSRREKNDRLNRGVELPREDDERLRERVRDANKRENECHSSFSKSLWEQWRQMDPDILKFIRYDFVLKKWTEKQDAKLAGQDAEIAGQDAASDSAILV
ncbi:hypothetical protein G6514_009769, partial [Epicoccum nigrum]